MPAAKKQKAMINQMTPHTRRRVSAQSETVLNGLPCEGQHPQILANAEASELFTLRSIVSSTNKRR